MLVSGEEVVVAIERVLLHWQAPTIAAIDGGGDSGTSTLPSMIADELGALLIPLDDFFSAGIPDSQQDLFTMEERLASVSGGGLALSVPL
jgi:hypothetical protein